MKLFHKFHSLFRREKFDAEMSAEMQAHVDLQAERNVAAGMNPDEARSAALRQFGNVASIQEQAREQRGWVWLEQILQDVRYAFRTLARSRGFTVITGLILALGIGANTAVFTVVDRAMLQELPVHDPDSLVIITKPDAQAPRTSESFSFPVYVHLREQSQTLDGLAAFCGGMRTMGIGAPGGETSLVQTQEVSGNFFSVLGVPAVIGRSLSVIDDAPGNPQPVVVLSHAMWERSFGSDPNVLGRQILLDDVSFTVVGVASRPFLGPSVGGGPDLWLPLQMIPRLESRSGGQKFQDAQSQWLFMIGRLKPGIGRDTARVELNLLFQGMLAKLGWKESQKKLLGSRLELQPGAFGYDRLGPEVRPLLTLLLALAGLVLLIVCGNVAGLLFARAAVRQRELAVRAALGASRGRLLRQLFLESVWLAFGGGLLGLLLAQWGTQLLTATLPMGAQFDLRPDSHVFLFAAMVSAGTGIVVGYLPAMRFSQLDLISAIKSQAQSISGGSRQRLQQLLVVGQVALSVCLLATAGLLVRTLQNLRNVDSGFDRENLLVCVVEFGQYFNVDYRAGFFRQMQAAGLETLPGVLSVTTADGYMFRGGTGKLHEFSIDGEPPTPGASLTTQTTLVGPRFFETFKLPLVRGRAFAAGETSPPSISAAQSPSRVMVINESMARKLFGARNPIGHVIRFVEPVMQSWPPFEIVGVAADARFESLRERSSFRVYMPYWHLPTRQRMWFHLRTAGDPLVLAPAIRQIIHRVDPQAKITELRTINDLVESALAPERTAAQATSFFSLLALILASMGLFGLLAYSTTQRTREIGVRIALGATPHDVIGLVMRQGLGLALFGCAGGIIGALLLSQLIASQLYGVTPTDPFTFVAVTGLLMVVALMACWLPARRAARVDPMVALRAE